MYTYKIWNKKDCIGNSTASEILERNNNFYKNDVFLVMYGNVITEMCDVEIYRVNNRFPLEYTTDEVAQAYIDKLNNPKEDDLQNKISILEAENAQMQYAMMMGGLL